MNKKIMKNEYRRERIRYWNYLRSELRKALDKGETDRCEACIEEIRQIETELARTKKHKQYQVI